MITRELKEEEEWQFTGGTLYKFENINLQGY